MAMANTILGKHAVEEIRESIGRCTNSREISAEAERLADLNKISKSRIYELTKDLRPKRKPRADRGKRTADLMEHDGLKYAASLVVEYHIDPAEAVRTTIERGFDIPVELATFTRYLRERGLSRKNRRMNRTNFRRFEAAAPGDVFQFDISGSKERWFDTKTRRIIQVSVLEVSKNHENENKNRTRVWRFVLTDDHSRRRFIRFVPCDKPNSSHVISFLLEAYQELGVPKILYTDNDAVIKFGRNQRASQILDKALESSGGYKLQQHLPGNSRATGKVEVAHQWVEKIEKLLGLFLKEGRDLTVEVLDRFSRQMSQEWDNRVHSSTGEKPIDRWNAQRHLVRTVDANLLRSAFLVDEFPINILGDLTFKHKGVSYQLPTNQGFENFVARQSKAEKCRIIFPDDADFYTLIDFDGNEYDIIKAVSAPDVFGDFKSTPDDVAETTRKNLKAFAKENAKMHKQQMKQGFEPLPIPIIDTTVELPKTNIVSFPNPTIDVTKEIVDHLPQNQLRKSSGYAGHLLSWYDAVRKFKEFFATTAECKEVLDTVYPNRDEFQPETMVREEVEKYLINRPALRLAQ